MFVLPALGAGARGRRRLGVSLSRQFAWFGAAAPDGAPGAMFCHATGNSGGAGAVSVDDELPMDIAICAGTMGLPAVQSGGSLEGSDARSRSIVFDCALRRTTTMSLAERR
jgi:hypothetical protein